MAVSPGFRAFILEQLDQTTPDIRDKRMFGGIGLWRSDARFTGDVSWTPLGGDVWTVEAPMEVRERSILTAADLDLVEDWDWQALFAAIGGIADNTLWAPPWPNP